MRCSLSSLAQLTPSHLSASKAGATAVALLISLAVALVLSQVGGHRVSAVHDGHLNHSYFALPFIENIPSTPLAFVPVYDCAGQGHTHTGLIADAVTAWNNTGRVKFFYTLGSETPCNAFGIPAENDRISILHIDLPAGVAGTHSAFTYPEAFRDNDIGAEGDLGMYRQRKSWIKIAPSPSGHSVPVLVHELGHAGGLADLYVEGSDPCVNAHEHIPDTTIMDCSLGPTPGQHDIDNLDLLYKRAPEQVNDFVASPATTTQITFAWTDRSYTEQYQFIAMVGEVFPLVAPRDAESAAWGGLEPNTTYCFFIQPRNAYLVLAPSSAQTCTTTTPPGGVGGIIELPAVAGTALDAPEAAGGNAGDLAGIVAFVVAVVSALGGAAWYARRRRHS